MPATINLTNGPAAATFSVGATDVGSGVGDVLVQLDHAFTTVAGQQYNLVFLGGASSLSQTFSAGSTSGVYNVTLLIVEDKAGNAAVYTAAQLQAMHLATSFTIAGGTGTGATGFTTPGGGTTGSQPQTSGTVTGTSAADTLTAHAGDTIYGGAGNDIITGGSGVTTSLYTGNLSNYVITQSGATATVADTVSSRDGTDTLNSISQAKFADYTVVFDLHSARDLKVYEIYQAAYGRIPDNAGYRYWSGIADASQATDTAVGVSLADAFLAAPEFTQLYGASPSNTAYITSLYSHVLARAPDTAGFAYWLGQANAGLAKDQLLVAFATSPENVSLIGSHVANGYWTT